MRLHSATSDMIQCWGCSLAHNSTKAHQHSQTHTWKTSHMKHIFKYKYLIIKKKCVVLLYCFKQVAQLEQRDRETLAQLRIANW